MDKYSVDSVTAKSFAGFLEDLRVEKSFEECIGNYGRETNTKRNYAFPFSEYGTIEKACLMVNGNTLAFMMIYTNMRISYSLQANQTWSKVILEAFGGEYKEADFFTTRTMESAHIDKICELFKGKFREGRDNLLRVLGNNYKDIDYLQKYIENIWKTVKPAKTTEPVKPEKPATTVKPENVTTQKPKSDEQKTETAKMSNNETQKEPTPKINTNKKITKNETAAVPDNNSSKKKVNDDIDRLESFSDTALMIADCNDLLDSVTESIIRSYVFHDYDYPDYSSAVKYKTEITVTEDRSLQAVRRLRKENPKDKIAVLNYANAFYSGGNTTKGNEGQEERLCRLTTLYPVLRSELYDKEFYKYHLNIRSTKASDTLIYTEDIKIIKSDDEYEQRLEKGNWINVDVMTMAAPDLSPKNEQMGGAELFGFHVKRATHMLVCAAARKADILVLGAFGCGAAHNSPEIVSRAYKVALRLFPGIFKKVEFAVNSYTEDKTDYDIFKKVILA